MKKVIIGLLVVVGAAGIIKLATSHPKLKASSIPTAATSSSAPAANSSSSASTSSSSSTTSSLKDGTYNGTAVNTPFGTVQVDAVVSGGKITNVKYPQMPYAHAYSQSISTQIKPMMKKEILSAQSANINLISGATFTSNAVAQSLQSALSQAN